MYALIGFYAVFFVASGIICFFYKKWGVALFRTLFCGMISISLITTQGMLFPEYFALDILLKILSFGFASFFLVRCLIVQKSVQLLKERSLLFSFLCMIFCTVIICFRNPDISIVLYALSMILLAPIFEEILMREIVFKLILENRSRKKIFSLFICCAFIQALFHLPLQSVQNCVLLFIFFFGLYILRYFTPKKSQFFLMFLIHSIWNTVAIIGGIWLC